MELKTEKQIRAKEIGDNLISVQMESHETKEYLGGCWSEPTKRIFNICLINGIKWIMLSDLRYGMTQHVNKMKKDGLINDYHILHVRARVNLTGHRDGQSQMMIVVIVQLSALAACKEELLGNRYLFDSYYHWERDAEAVIDAALDADVKAENFFKGEELVENEQKFAERCRLIAENNQEKRRKNYEEDEEEQPAAEEPQPTEEEHPSDDNENLKPFALLAEKITEIIGENQNLRKQVENLKVQKECLEKMVEIYKKIEAIRMNRFDRQMHLIEQLIKDVSELTYSHS